MNSHCRWPPSVALARHAARCGLAVCLLAFVGGCSAVGPGPHDATSTHPFDDVSKWASVFDDPGREVWQKPAALVEELALQPGQSVADLGAGTGYFLSYLAAAVGPQGTVFAADPEPNLVVHLRDRAEKEGLSNVIPILASSSNSRLPCAGVDTVLIVDTFHHIDDRVAYLRRLRSCLREAGRVAVVDWKKEALPLGPPLDHKLARELVIEEFRDAGYELKRELDLLPYQYFLIFQDLSRSDD